MMEMHGPPQRFLRFFRWFCHPKLLKYIEGDLIELYHLRLKESGKKKADIKFIIDVLLLFRPGIIRPAEEYTNINYSGMYKSFFKIGWRNILRNKGYSLINVGGLAAGMAVAMLIGLWIYDEMSFNKNHQNYDRIAQVMQTATNNGEKQTSPPLPYPLANELRTNYSSDFDCVVMSGGEGDHILAFEEKKITKSGVYFEPQVAELLTLKMLKGTRNGLKNQNAILLSASLSKALFGDADPINKPMKIDNKLDVNVAGVYEDLPHNSTFAHISFIAPWDLYFNNTEWIRTASDPWRPNAFKIYVLLAKNADLDRVSLKIKDEKLKNVNEQLALKKPELFLHPMKKWHLYSEFKNGINVGGRISYVWLFGIIGSFVLLIACINFMNLSTAQSEKRAKEAGIRKAIGSLRKHLVGQFFCESVIIAAFSFLMAMVLVQILIPFFNEIADKKMSIPWGTPVFWLLGIVFSLITGVIAGSYPAYYFSSVQPVKILKGTFGTRHSATPRKVLVVLQFTFSVTMIIGTIVVFQQVQFAKNRPIGYDINGLIALPMVTENIHKHFDAVENELINAGAIISMAETGNPTTGIGATSSGFEWEGKDPSMSVDFPRIDVSYDYGKTIGWELKEGRDFSKDFSGDTSVLIVNEAAVKFMALQNPVGTTIRWFGDPYTIIGVVKDLTMQSPYEEARPSVFNLYNDAQNFVVLKINPAASVGHALNKIETVLKKYNPEQPFEYRFVDNDYAKKFGSEERIGKLVSAFGVFAVFISCLGLFGLASFTAEQRTKEIGIRKVVGASVLSLWGLLSKDFVLLVVISCVIAIPIAYFSLSSWLQGYTYRTEIAWWIFALAMLGSMVITLLTVSFHAIKAAIANPVKSLRSE